MIGGPVHRDTPDKRNDQRSGSLEVRESSKKDNSVRMDAKEMLALKEEKK